MFKKIALGVVAALVLFCGFVATRPDTFTVTRTAVVPGTPDVAFAMVNDFHQWKAWSPWDNLDPNMKRTFGGAESGTGATYGWTGNNDVGEGQMTLQESKPAELVRVKLEFIKPFASSSITTFTFKPVDGSGTQVTWAMTGDHNFISKAMCVFMDMDKVVGKDFDKGLASMKTAAQAEVARRAEAAEAARKLAEAKAAEEAAAAAAAAAAPAEGAPAVAVPTP